MAESIGETNKFMAEIIRLLTDLVSAVKVNEDLIRETQNVIKNSQSMIENIAQSAGMKNIMAAGQSLENAIGMLQKGVQAFEIQNALRQVQEFLGAMSGISPAPQGSRPQIQPQSGAGQQKAGPEDNLIKPSDLFK